jgi:hypothetical protein
MDGINIWGVVAATVAQVAVGGIWYSALFGRLWGQIHGFDKLSPEVQKEMAAKMGPFYGVQVLVTILTVGVLAKAIVLLPDYSPYALASLAWLGFILPTQYSAVVFGGTEAPWIVKKLAVMALGSLACLLVGAAVLQLF